jgi:Bacterial alpha-L-rhamnosidase 6 hairpin glycosidase domain/Bacterial alpha-L-rhamnosidase C-terminal domain
MKRTGEKLMMQFRLFFVPIFDFFSARLCGKFSQRICISFLIPLTLQAASAPTGLLCDLLEHPEETVITTVTPEFGWIYNPSFRNDSQAAYRIVVASSQTLADQGVGDLWDSGVVSNSASINVPYAGATLQANTDYFWCVQTVDSAGQTSAFSTVQHFRTDTQLASPPILPVTTGGLQWVWYPESPAATDVTRYFRKTFVVPANIGAAGAQILLTADDQFALYVNGTFVGSGINWKQFSLFSLNSFIQTGTNTIAIAASNILNQAGLTGRLDYRGADGSTNTIFIDGTWLTSSNLTAIWNQPGFDDSSWSNASVLGGYGISPWNTTAVLPLTGLIYNSSTNLWANRYPLRFVSAAPVLVTNTAPGRWFVDFGQDAFGYATVHLNGLFSGTNVQARFGEMSNSYAVNTSPPSGSTVRYATATFTLQNGDVIYPVRPPTYSGQTISPPSQFGVVMPFRYFELTNFPGTLTVTDVAQQQLLYEFNTNAASFSSSSPALNQIWNLCRNSMQVFGFDGIYVDGDRERTPYEADSYIHQLSSYAVDREFTMPRYSFEYLLTHPTWPTEWKFHMIFIAWADYLQTGNTDLLYRYYDALKPDTFTWAATGNGLMRGFPGFAQTTNSDIVDWPAADRDGFAGISSSGYRNWTNSVNNAYYYRCLQIMANIATIIGRTNDATNYSASAAQTFTNYNSTFWNSGSQSYVDGVGTSHSSAHANFFPLAFGLVPGNRQTAVVNYLHSRIAADNGMPPSVFGAQYLLEALFESGDADTALGLMTTNGTRGWLNMIHLGSTLTTEAWSFTDKPNEDWNHAWGAAAGNLIQRFVLGLRPITAGCGQILIQPQLGQTLTCVQGVVPTVRGPVSIQVTNAPGQFQLLLNIPGNVTATVMLPTFGAINPVALVDGNMVSGTVSNDWLTVTNIGSGQHAVWLNTNNAPSQAALYNNWAAGWFGADVSNDSIAGMNADPDGDGVSNFNEFIAGTNPQDATDWFHIANSSYTSSGPVMAVTVAGKIGRHYTLQHTFALDPASWISADTQTAGSDNQMITLHDFTLSGSTQAFLRVTVIYP